MKFWNCLSCCKDKKITATGCHQKQSDSQLPLTATSGEFVPFFDSLVDMTMEGIQTKILRGNIYWSIRSVNRQQDLSGAYRLFSEF